MPNLSEMSYRHCLITVPKSYRSLRSAMTKEVYGANPAPRVPTRNPPPRGLALATCQGLFFCTVPRCGVPTQRHGKTCTYS